MFVHPALLLLLVLAVAVVWAYRRRPARVALTGAGHLWAAALAERWRSAAWRRRRRGFSLGLALVILTLVALAAAEPLLRARGRVILILDNSATMNARAGEGTRLEEARRRAREQIAALGYRDAMAVLACGGQIEVRLPLTGRRAWLDAAVDAIDRAGGESRAAEAVALARAALGDDPGGRIVLVSDGCFAGADKLRPAADVAFVQVGRPADNLAITRLASRPRADDPERHELLVEVRSCALHGAKSRLTLEADGKPLEGFDVDLAPGARWQRIVSLPPSPVSRRVEAKLVSAGADDALPLDDTATVEIPPGKEGAAGSSNHKATAASWPADEPQRIADLLAAAVPADLRPRAALPRPEAAPKGDAAAAPRATAHDVQSDLRTGGDVPEGPVMPPARGAAPVWPWLALAAALLAALEWCAFQRRWTC